MTKPVTASQVLRDPLVLFGVGLIALGLILRLIFADWLGSLVLLLGVGCVAGSLYRIIGEA